MLYLARNFLFCEEVYGQQINLHKSNLSFSPNAQQIIIDVMANVLGIPVVACHERYLGLPTMVSRGHWELSNSVHDRIWSRLNGWKEKSLWTGGNEEISLDGRE